MSRSMKLPFLPLALLLSGCDRLPEVLIDDESPQPALRTTTPVPDEKPSESPPESQAQLRQLAYNPVLQSECSYQCAEAGFERGGQCKKDTVHPNEYFSGFYFCWCLVEVQEFTQILQKWLAEKTCYSVSEDSPSIWCNFSKQIWSQQSDPLPNPISYGGGYWSLHYLGRESDSCKIWAGSISGFTQFGRAIRTGVNATESCMRWAQIPYSCTKYK